ncbi:glycine cleavage system protein GcvH [Candidatus Viridilinea mediisalina]|uniref:Glycine cleavage system H protein n=1 Tax=Candidatus Viridilinea mediisalina TaxID=2024553 RepID=A0A2A6RNK1_9CHLR|nr:glycine cleavage system protein GcvH [Candidatus Viridilinea mediisalina]PDW04471.1 glycine cleavage system protein H [Candidatus Viridilinea mediisalina]
MATNIPTELRYSKTDEWVRVEGAEVVVGISDFAQHALGDIVYLELPSVGAVVQAGASFGVIESVKASSDLNAPVGGEVIAVNNELEASQEAINQDPYGAGWLIRLRPSGDEDELMDAEAYAAHCAERNH